MRPKKSLSQNFLIDKNICKKIINQIDIKNKNIIEIGPGLGSLTDFILEEEPKKLYLIEKDSLLSEKLNHKYSKHKNIFIYNDDILTFNLSELKNLNIISNLPYNVSTKIILHLLNHYKIIDDMILMVQKEVAHKFDYNLPKMNKYKFFTSMMSIYQRCFDVSPNVFKPKPKVNSTIVKFKLKKNINDNLKLETFSKIIFSNMRKKINSKFNITNSENLLLNKRVDELSIDELLEIYNFF